MVHISQLGSTIAVDTTKLKDGELGQILETLDIEAKTRIQTRRKELDNNETEQVKFLIKCRNLAQSVIPGSTEVDTDKPLEKSYHLFESVVSSLQTDVKHKRREKRRNNSTTNAVAHSVL